MSQDIEYTSCPHCGTQLVAIDNKGWCQHCDKFRARWCEDEGCEVCFPADED